MRDQLLQNKEKARGKKKEKVMAMTQGAASSNVDETKSAPATPSKTAGGGNKGGKKKKGKK